MKTRKSKMKLQESRVFGRVILFDIREGMQ